MGLVTFLWSQKSCFCLYKIDKAQIEEEKRIPTKADKPPFQGDCVKIVSAKNHL
jgi:hypothetical protein